MIYHSKVDLLLLVILTTSIFTPVALGLTIFLFAAEERAAGGLMFLIGLTTGVFILWLIYPLYYQITADVLLIRCGPLRWNIPLIAITEIQPTHNPLSAPALSLDRLLIRYREKGQSTFVLISPKDRDAFLDEIARVTPNIVVDRA